jgi:hypothetical protein
MVTAGQGCRYSRAKSARWTWPFFLPMKRLYKCLSDETRGKSKPVTVLDTASNWAFVRHSGDVVLCRAGMPTMCGRTSDEGRFGGFPTAVSFMLRHELDMS